MPQQTPLVTFHPDYSYGQFVGSYKPVSDDNGKINYEYVPGPFMRILKKAIYSENNEPFFLIIEEITNLLLIRHKGNANLIFIFSSLLSTLIFPAERSDA